MHQAYRNPQLAVLRDLTGPSGENFGGTRLAVDYSKVVSDYSKVVSDSGF